jgi:aryl-alcohol dehydrogenase-like predicted oxidoreductase
MGMSWGYGPSDADEAVRVLHRSLDLGSNFWDTAELYGPFRNEELLGRALKGKNRDAVIIATKFAYRFGPKGEMAALDSSPAHVRETVEGSLKRLGTDYIDLYYQHRVDPKTPIEDTVGAMADLVRAGKVRYIGLSEAGPGTIRRGHVVHPISAVQMEYSLWERGIEAKVLATLRELGIGLVAYSPIGRGFLSGKIQTANDLDSTDLRRNHPRFQGANFAHNFELVEVVKAIASAHDATPAQVALAWVLHQGKDIVPIPGTKHIRYLEENAAAANLQLPNSAWLEIDQALSSFTTAGQRYPEAAMKVLDTTE